MNEKLLLQFKRLNSTEKKQLRTNNFLPDFKNKSLLNTNLHYKIPIFTEDFF